MIASADLDQVFAALADPTRREILVRLAATPATVRELAEPFALSQPAISKHLKVLERAGLISTRVDGQRRPRRIEPAALATANEWIEKYLATWQRNYARLDALLERTAPADAHPAPSSAPEPSRDAQATALPRQGATVPRLAPRRRPRP